MRKRRVTWMRKALPLFVVIGLVLAACQPSEAESPTESAAASEEAPASQEPFSPSAWPEDGPADCEYGGEFSQISATDEHTVVFSLCYPDPAFLSKIAFTSFAIHDSGVLEANMANHLILADPIGTGPYMLRDWQRGVQLVFDKNPDYWGEMSEATSWSSSGGPSRPPASWPSRPERRTRSTTRRPMTSPRSRATATFSSSLVRR
jgi:hypothetical protein